MEAKVQGRRKAPYKVTIHIGRLSEEKCQSIIGRCNQKISSIETLVSGEFPEELKDVFTEEGGLFPTPREISFSCTCPDWALMCKHVSAVMYAEQGWEQCLPQGAAGQTHWADPRGAALGT